MVDFWFSEEGRKEYEKIGKRYPKHPFDVSYDEFLRKTSRSPAEQNRKYIDRIIRVKSTFGSDGSSTISSNQTTSAYLAS